MSQEHDAIRDLIAPVALGAAEEHERLRVESHAAECAVCAEELGHLRAATAVLALGVPQVEPSPRTKAPIMAIVRAEAAARAKEHDEAGIRSAPARRTGWFSRLARPVPAFATAAVVAALAIAGVTLTSDDAPRPVQTIEVTAGIGAPDGLSGRVVYVPSEDTAVVRLTGMPTLPEGQAYQLWVLRDGEATSAGLFESTAPGRVERAVSGLADADALAVTAQSAESILAPEGPVLAQATI